MSSVIEATVVGGGPAGVVCAMQLHKAGVRTRLVFQAPSRARPAELLAPPTIRSLRSMGLEVRDLVGQSLACKKSVAAWTSSEPEVFDYELFMREPARVVDRAVLDHALVDLARSSGVGCLIGRVSLLRAEQPGWALGAAGERWTSRCLLDASGRQGFSAPARDRLHRDRLVAIHCSWAVSAAEPWLTIEAAADGWWYLMPRSCDVADLVYMTDFDMVPEGRAARSLWLAQQFALTGSIRARSTAPPAFDLHKALDARSSRARRFTGDNLLVLGDAAWANDPLSGKGIALAMEQATQAAGVVCVALAGGGEPGRDTLHSYEQWCETQYSRSELARARTYAAGSPRFPGTEFWRRRRSTLPARTSRAETVTSAQAMAESSSATRRVGHALHANL